MAKYLAVAGNEKEFSGIVEFAEQKLGGGDKAIVICNYFFPLADFDSEKISAVRSESFLTEKDAEDVEERAGFFAQNWYRFSPEFDEKTTINGISMGYVHQHEFSLLFKKTFLLFKALQNAAEKHKPEAVIAPRNSFAGECAAAAVEAKGLCGMVLLDLETEKKFRMFPNFTPEKLGEIRRKLPKILAELAPRGGTAGRKTVFIRSRGYLEGLKKRLAEDRTLNVVSLDEFLLRKMLNPLNAYSYMSGRHRMQRFFRPIFSEFVSSGVFNEKMVFEGIKFGKIIQPLMLLAQERDWPEFVFLAETLSRFFDGKKNSVLALWEDFVAFERICALAAEQKRIESIVIQHGLGLLGKKGRNWIRGYVPLTAGKIAVWGERFRKVLLENGIPPQKIVVTGSPRFDELANKLKKSGPSSASGAKRVLLIAQHGSFNQSDIKKIIREIPKENKTSDVRFVVKLHPMDYSKIDRELAEMAEIVKGANFYGLLGSCDAVITESSTGGLEAMILGKPVIAFGGQVPIENRSVSKFYGETKAALKASNGRELGAALGTALKGGGKIFGLEKEMEKFVVECLGAQDGRATERVIELIKSA